MVCERMWMVTSVAHHLLVYHFCEQLLLFSCYIISLFVQRNTTITNSLLNHLARELIVV